MPSGNAAVAIFAFRRAAHLKKVVESLYLNPECSSTTLYVFIDGPSCVSDRVLVADVKKYIGTIRGFKQIKIFESDINLGLAKSILNGVSKVFEDHGEVIVLEEDVVVSDAFLSYMNGALLKYKADNRMLSVSGYSYPFNNKSDGAFLMRVPHSWGWATWRDRWSGFDPNPSILLTFAQANPWVRHIRREAPYDFVSMLKNRVRNKNNSWLCSWAVHGYIHNMFTIYPRSSMCANIGIDGTGTHCSKWFFDPFKVAYFDSQYLLPDHPAELSSEGKLALKLFFLKVQICRFFNKILRVFKFV